MRPIKHAIILAAGRGLRLWPYTQERPKCLLDIGGKTLLEHQVTALRSQHIQHITVVTGYLGNQIRALLGTSVTYIDNPDFVCTSSMYSLWLARYYATQGCMILNADVLFHEGILQALLTSPHADALAVDFDAVLCEEETKVMVEKGRVQAMSKKLLSGHAENVGMIKMSAAGSCILFDKINTLLEQNYHQEMVPFAMNAIAPSRFLAAISVAGLPWIEIDFPEDYQRACQVIYPTIQGLLPNTASPSKVSFAAEDYT